MLHMNDTAMLGATAKFQANGRLTDPRQAHSREVNRMLREKRASQMNRLQSRFAAGIQSMFGKFFSNYAKPVAYR